MNIEATKKKLEFYQSRIISTGFIIFSLFFGMMCFAYLWENFSNYKDIFELIMVSVLLIICIIFFFQSIYRFFKPLLVLAPDYFYCNQTGVLKWSEIEKFSLHESNDWWNSYTHQDICVHLTNSKKIIININTQYSIPARKILEILQNY